MIFDKNDKKLGWSWKLGAKLYKGLGLIDDAFGAETWEEAFEWLLERSKGQVLREVQFWGHGNPGSIYLDGKRLDTKTIVADQKLLVYVKMLGARMRPNSLVWLRTCSSFEGKRGKDFAKSLSKSFGCAVAGHTHIIGPFQGGLRPLKYNQEPYWDSNEGRDPNTRVAKSSWPMITPNTITMLNGNIPDDFWV